MKKVLFASTALALSAGFAAADVKITGSAEMGIQGGDVNANNAAYGNGIETQFFQDIDVTFTMTGETDGGLSFGAAIDLDEVEGAKTTTPQDDFGTAIFIKGAFGSVTMGDTDGAMDWALTEGGNVGNPGSINDDETSYAAYRGSYLDGGYDGQIVRYDNTFGDFGVAISVEMDDGVVGAATPANQTVSDTGFAIGLKYNLDLSGTTVALGLGYQTRQDSVGGGAAKYDVDAVGFSATATLANGLSLGAMYTSYDSLTAQNEDTDYFQLGVGYKMDALSLHANYSDLDSTIAANDVTGFGLAASYDLGGGASIRAGYGKSKFDVARANGNDSANSFSLGLKMSF